MQRKVNIRDSHQKWPVDGLESVTNCPVCGADKKVLLHEGLTDRVFFCAPGEWSIYRCESCVSTYIDPRPTPETIGLAYQQYFTHKEVVGYSSLSFLGKIRRRLANDYRNFRYGTRDTPSSVLGIFIASLMPNIKAGTDAAMRHLPKAKTGSRLLDLGCGNGEFLLRARSAGWDVVGVDFDAKAVDFARRQNLDVRLGGVDALDSSVEQFDAITLCHVIEHVHDPVDVLCACYKLLKPGGFLWLETPNITSEGYRLFGTDWLALDPPRHLVLFNQKSMEQALKSAGFSETEIMPYRPLCDDSFGRSFEIVEGRDPFSETYKNRMGDMAMVKDAEDVAKKDSLCREFITVKAWK